MTTTKSTKIISAHGDALSKEELSLVRETVKRGGLVVFPTETVYGLGADGTNDSAAHAIYEAKGRPSNNPLIIHIANPADADRYCVTSELYDRLAAAFMPGPLTVILPKKDIIPQSVTGGLATVAVRCPSHPIANAIIRACETPIAAPSANLSGKPSPTCAKYCIEDMNGRADIIIDGGDCLFGIESTIVKPEDDGSVTLLRPGAVTVEDLLTVAERVNIADGVIERPREDALPLSPGMLYKHYAPTTDFYLLDGCDEAIYTYLNTRENNCVFLMVEEDKPHISDNIKTISLGSREHPEEEAHLLFTALRRADEMGADTIYARLPDEKGLNLALLNRLIRASAHRIIKL